MSVLLAALSDPFLAFVLGASGSQGFVDVIQAFIGPIFLLGIGIAAMSFLFQRQMMQFLQFMVLAVGIAVLLYYPEVIKNAAGIFKNIF